MNQFEENSPKRMEDEGKKGDKQETRVISRFYLIVRLLGRVINWRIGSRTCGFLQYRSIHSIIILRNEHINAIIIQQIVTLSKYGHDALDICHP